MKKLICMVSLLSSLLFGCQEGNVVTNDVEDYIPQEEIEVEAEQEDVEIVEEIIEPEIQTDEVQDDNFDLELFEDYIEALGQQAQEDGIVNAVDNLLFLFEEIALTTEQAEVHQLVEDLVAFNNTPYPVLMMYIAQDLDSLYYVYDSEVIFNTWQIISNMYYAMEGGQGYNEEPLYEEEDPEYNYEEPEETYEEPEEIYEEPAYEEEQETYIMYTIDAYRDDYSTLDLLMEFGSPNENGVDFIVFDFLDGAEISYDNGSLPFHGSDMLISQMSGIPYSEFNRK